MSVRRSDGAHVGGTCIWAPKRGRIGKAVRVGAGRGCGSHPTALGSRIRRGQALGGKARMGGGQLTLTRSRRRGKLVAGGSEWAVGSCWQRAKLERCSLAGGCIDLPISTCLVRWWWVQSPGSAVAEVRHALVP